MVIHTDFNQGIQIRLTDGASMVIQATVEKGQMRYWVGKPDDVTVTMVQCRASSKLGRLPQSQGRPPSVECRT